MTTVVPGGAIAALRFAGFCLRDAQYRIDDAGLASPDLDALVSDTADLASRWQGRPGRPVEVRADIAASAIAWRLERARRASR